MNEKLIGNKPVKKSISSQ